MKRKERHGGREEESDAKEDEEKKRDTAAALSSRQTGRQAASQAQNRTETPSDRSFIGAGPELETGGLQPPASLSWRIKCECQRDKIIL